MPIYSFRCDKGHEHDLIVPMNTEETICPECKGQTKRIGIEVPAKRNPQYGLQV